MRLAEGDPAEDTCNWLPWLIACKIDCAAMLISPGHRLPGYLPAAKHREPLHLITYGPIHKCKWDPTSTLFMARKLKHQTPWIWAKHLETFSIQQSYLFHLSSHRPGTFSASTIVSLRAFNGVLFPFAVGVRVLWPTLLQGVHTFIKQDRVKHLIGNTACRIKGGQTLKR